MVNSWGSGGHRPIESRVKLLGFHLPRWDDPPRPHSQKWPHFLTPFLTLFPKSSNFEAWFFSPDLRGVKKRVLFSPFFDRFLTPLEPFFTNHVQACSKLALMVVHVSPKIYDSIQYWKKGAQNRTSFWVPIFHFLTLFWPLFITLNHEMPWIQVQNFTQFFNYQLIYEKKVYKN